MAEDWDVVTDRIVAQGRREQYGNEPLTHDIPVQFDDKSWTFVGWWQGLSLLTKYLVGAIFAFSAVIAIALAALLIP